MTDLSPSDVGTVACPNCGGQNRAGRARCEFCAATLTAVPSSDEMREDLELEEVWRAAAAEGWDTDVTVEGRTGRCSACGGAFDVAEVAWESSQPVRDSATGQAGLRVVVLPCPRCASAARFVIPDEALPEAEPRGTEEAEEPTEVRRDEVDTRAWSPAKTAERPLGEDRPFFERARPGNLADQGPLVDEQGEDIRHYTGEPVETEEGWVLPRQQNVGPGNEAGGGEWPDPNAPSAQPSNE